MAVVMYQARQYTNMTMDRMNNLLDEVAIHLPGVSTHITELKIESDFLDMDPECVDTPKFYGGNDD